jgi:FtsZ-binding cell division protein ZapB
MRSAIISIIILDVVVFAVIEFLLHSNPSFDIRTQETKALQKQISYERNEKSSADVQIARLNKEVEHLKNKVDKLAQAIQFAQASNQFLQEDNNGLEEDDIVVVDEDETSGQGLLDKFQTVLDQRFAIETPDLEWSDQMELQFQSSLDRLPDFGLKDTQMIYQECRATLCNAEFVHGKDENPQLLATALTMPDIEGMTVVSEESADGMLISKVIFYREGFSSDDSAE